jgi:inorganic triphosphatase YgiF
MHRELEIKVELSRSDVARLEGDLPASDLGIGPVSSTRLRSIYFDTPEHDLHAAGISLRVRHQDGAWQQTVKADQHVDDGLSNPIELADPLDSEEPDVAKITDENIKRAVEKAIKGSAIYPIFETVVQRLTRKITAKDGEVELAVDDGEVRAGDSTTPLREAELELKAGSAEALLFAAEKLLAGQEFKLSRRSTERGHRLALGKRGSHAEPEKKRPAAIRRKDTCARALATVFKSATHQIVTNRAAVLETGDPQAAHQLRIGLRRLRSALRVARPLADGNSLRAFERGARDLGRCVGELRNADVLISGLHAPMEAVASDKTGFAQLREALIRNREVKRDEVRTSLRGPAWTKLQLYLALWPPTLQEIPKLERPIAKHARKVLRKTWKKPEKLGRGLDELNEEQRHELRKSLKKLRYQAEFFAPLFAKARTDRFIARLKELQDIFGYINDARMAPKLAEIQKEQQAGEEAAKAAGYAIGRHEAEAGHLWKQGRKAWKKLERTRQFWE